jgi:hypothetical protein
MRKIQAYLILALTGMPLLLTACGEGIGIRGYDYEKREKAKVILPKGSAMDLDTDTFVIKKKYKFPY